MKQTISKALTMVLCMLGSVLPCFSQTEEQTDELSTLLVEGSLPVTFTNDADYPWTVEGRYATNGNLGVERSKSSLIFRYSSTLKTELSFVWAFYNYTNQYLRLYVDGTLYASCSSHEENALHFFLPAGEHVVEFRDSIGISTNPYNWSQVSNIRVLEIVDVAGTVLTDKSLPIEFINDEDYPWTVEDGFIQSSNYGINNSKSTLSTTVSIDKPSKLSFYSEIKGSSSFSNDYHSFQFYINGECYFSRYSGSGITSVVLTPGTYELSWEEDIYYSFYNVDYYANLKDVELTNSWTEVEVSTPGTLGVEVLYQVNVLNDVELLKVKGTINETDWANIKQMKNLAGIDLSEAKFDAVPSSAFSGLSRLSYCLLPDGCTAIGASAFTDTQILDIDIPSSVVSIGESAFSGTRIRTCNFKEDSQLKSIGYQAFYNCSSLKEFNMPNTVTELKRYQNDTSNNYSNTFRGCTSLAKIHFSDALTCIPYRTCYDCTKLSVIELPGQLKSIEQYAFYNTTSLQSIVIPQTVTHIGNYAFENAAIDSLRLPVKLTSLGQYAFRDCNKLKYIELPSYISSYNYNFQNCRKIETIVCKSATPPAISYDPIYGGPSKSKITLYVPSFAVANYKLDPYWYLFGNIQEMDVPLDYWNISGNLMLTNNRRMEGKPDVDLYYGGQLTVGGNAPMEVKNYNIYVSEGNPSRMLNNCDAFTADSITTIFSVSANTWYFFTPLHDTAIKDVTHSANASFVFRYYNGQQRATSGTGNSWKNVSDGMLRAGQGYIFQCNAAGTVVMPAIKETQAVVFNSDEVTKMLTAYESDNTANKNWNYVGNPYPCYYDIYYMDFTAPITIRNGNNYYAYSISDDNYVLRPMQSFFVQKPDAVDDIVFRPEGRQLSPTVNRSSSQAPAMKTGSTEQARFVFDIDLKQGKNYDRTRIVLNEDKSLDYETDCDAAKFMSDDPTMAQIFTTVDGTRLSINERPRENGTIALGITTGAAGEYTITSPRHDAQVLLHDAEKGTTTDLSVEDYTFTTNGASVMPNRFTLSFKEMNPTAIENVTGESAKIFGGKGVLNIHTTNGSQVVVYTADGITVGTFTKSITLHLPKGIYVVTVNGVATKTIVR